MLGARGWLGIWLALSWLVQPATAADAASAPKSDKTPPGFMRVTRDNDNAPLALETPIIRFAPAGGGPRGLRVDLVAAIHIAEKSYYRQLNAEFRHYDAVLYELVAAEESSVPRPGDADGKQHPLSMLQNAMKDMLGLEFQLQGIDYTRKNMIHADMSPEQFAASMQKRGESVTAMFARMLGYAMARQSDSADGASEGNLLLAFFDKNRKLALKRALAEQFAAGEGALTVLDGPGGSTLISGRNQVALDVLGKQIAAGKRKIAIFFGAAHMPDLQSRLRKDFRLTPVSTRWLAAWDLKR
jgi:hypothetical protein